MLIASKALCLPCLESFCAWQIETQFQRSTYAESFLLLKKVATELLIDRWWQQRLAHSAAHNIISWNVVTTPKGSSQSTGSNFFVAVNHAVYVQIKHSFCNSKAVMDLSCIFPDPAEPLNVISSQVKESLHLYNDKMVSLFFRSAICMRYLVCCLPIWDDFCNSRVLWTLLPQFLLALLLADCFGALYWLNSLCICVAQSNWIFSNMPLNHVYVFIHVLYNCKWPI
jgi:hypothetical protein